jgi:hypothetical protein
MKVLLLAALLAQDPEVVLSARAKKGAEGYELQVRGQGPGLSEEAKVSLRLRRLVNRLEWADGSLSTIPLDPPAVRTPFATQGAFNHREIFRGPQELAIEVVVETPDGTSRPPVLGTVRIAPGYEVAAALKRDARRAAAALEEARRRSDEIALLADSSCPASARQLGALRKRLERQRAAWADADAGTLLSATAPLVEGFLADLDRAIDAVAGGQGLDQAVSGLSGEPLSVDEARRNLETIERVLLREQALVLLREAQEARRDIGQAAATGCPFRWARVEASAARTLAALREFEEDVRSGPQGPCFAELTECEKGPSLAEILQTTQEFLNVASSAVVCPRSVEGELEQLEGRLNERGAQLEEHLRGMK